MPQPVKTQPLWVRVDENRFKLTVFVASFVLVSSSLLTGAFIGVPGTLIGGAMVLVKETGADQVVHVVTVALGGTFVVIVLAGAVTSAVQLSNAEHWVRARFGAVELDRSAEPGLQRVVGDMALAAGLTATPSTLLIETDRVNAGVGTALAALGPLKADAEGMLLLRDPAPMLSALRTATTSSNPAAIL